MVKERERIILSLTEIFSYLFSFKSQFFMIFKLPCFPFFLYISPLFSSWYSRRSRLVELYECDLCGDVDVDVNECICVSMHGFVFHTKIAFRYYFLFCLNFEWPLRLRLAEWMAGNLTASYEACWHFILSVRVTVVAVVGVCVSVVFDRWNGVGEICFLLWFSRSIVL